MRYLIPLLILSALVTVGCRDRADVPYLGRWDGDFTVTRLVAKTQVNNPKRNNWKGFILLYRTEDGSLGNRCRMHMENEQEAVDLKGHWKVRRRQIAVTFDDIKIDDAGGADVRDPNKSYLDPIDIRRAFKAPLALNVLGHHRMASPLVLFGPLVGEYSFSKATLAH